MISQLINNNGNYAANQFVIKTENAIYFQSYQSVIAKIENGELTLSLNWDYSKTTSKHLYIFLQDYGHGKYNSFCSANKMRNAIKSGYVKVESVSSLKIK